MRTFLAINLPAPIRRRVWSAVTPLRKHGFPVRWVAPDLIHLTVKFLGEVQPELVQTLAPTLSSVTRRCRRFDLSISGLGGFPNLRRPRVVFAEIVAPPALEILHDSVERAMHGLGFPLDGRPFRPHLTLGRAHRDATPASWRGLNQMTAAVRIDERVAVSSIDVMESRLHATGPEYFVRASATLEA